MIKQSAPPLDQLFALGKVTSREPWQDYQALGISKAHVPALIAIATDLDLNWADENSQEVWAPLHAWRALAQLRANEALQPLVDLIDELAEDDWFSEDLPEIMAHFGPPAVAPLTHYLSTADLSNWTGSAANVIEGLARIGKKYPEMRRQIVATLTSHLQHYERNADGINAWLIDDLLTLRAKKALPVIAAAFAAEAVDEMFFGWDRVQQEFQLAADSQPGDFL